MSSIPFVSSIAYLSDLSERDTKAFAHALAIALLRQTRLTLLHAQSPGGEEEWRRAPSVRRTLESWGMLELGSPRSAVFEQLAIDVRKVGLGGIDPMHAVLTYLESHTADLLVVGTERREGLPRWLNPSFAEQVSRRSETMTLFVPNTVRGFVSLVTGEISLQRILIPVDWEPSPTAAITYAIRASQMVQRATDIALVHLGKEQYIWPELPERENISWHRQQGEGEVVAGIIDWAHHLRADLIIMSTQGHHGIWDALRGSTTEQVLRHSPCPVLAVPAHLGGEATS